MERDHSPVVDLTSGTVPGDTFVDDALESRRINKIDKLIRRAAFPIPGATVAEADYRDGRGITPVRM